VKVNYLIASPLGMVVSSDPAAGTQAAQGSTVTLNVA
jgi:beta-lactam-binding protein with PASTA domain